MTSTNRQLVDELAETFNAELEERLESMNSALLDLERGASGSGEGGLVEALFRDAHSLKGGAQLLGRDELAEIAHAMEAHLDEVRSAGSRPAALAQLFAAVDAMARLGRGDELSSAEHRGVIAGLAAPTDGSGSNEPRLDVAEPPTGARSDPGEQHGNGHQRADRSGLRVSAERLDALIARSGELITARDAASRQHHDIQQLATALAGLTQRWSDLVADVRRVASGIPDGRIRDLVQRIDTIPAELAEREREARAIARDARVAVQRFRQLVDNLEAELRDLRMVPVARLFRQFPRMVRDLGESLAKPVQLQAVGWETAIDRELLERIKDPVMHLLRNAVDHGIEPAKERGRRGKPALGSIALEARREADRIVIEVRDDGGGIDRGRVGQIAGARPAAASVLSGDPDLAAIFAPGFSTLASASEVSGRGVGLDVVATAIQSLGGTIEVASDASGTSFTLRVPLTLISTRVLVLHAGTQRYALPIDAVQHVFRFGADQLAVHGGQQTVTVDDRALAVADLGAALGHPPTALDGDRQLIGVTTSAPNGRVAFVVAAVEGEREVVIKPLVQPIGRTPLIAGAALVDNDAVMLVLDHAALAASVTGTSAQLRPAEAAPDRSRAAERPLRILVADDSITTRTLEKNILSAAGFDVALAADGHEALRTLRHDSFDLLVSDVDMPGMDGFELTERLRAEDATRELPVILVTSKERPEDRKRGLHAGADAYLLKSEFDHQALLQTIREVVG